jgi:HD-GYP domain-containing protein (c-di-GMP phosphodiesterase class II)
MQHVDAHAPSGVHSGLRERQDAAVEALIAISTILNPAVTRHSEAAALLSTRTASTMGLDEATIFRIERIAHIHDIGLNGVDPRIIDKPEPLTEHEYNILRLHAERGAQMLRATPCLAEWAPLVRSHHERFDGKGYPDQLCGLEIPIECRVLSVADAFHAMTTPQRWREMRSPFAAVQELMRKAGSQFDPDVVDALAATLGVRRAGRSANSA